MGLLELLILILILAAVFGGPRWTAGYGWSPNIFYVLAVILVVVLLFRLLGVAF